MRNLDIIIKEIVELSEIKSACNHYLSSHRGLTEVENATLTKKNLIIIGESLRELFAELALSKKEKCTVGKIEAKTIRHNALEQNAIQLFNSDRRFTITE